MQTETQQEQSHHNVATKEVRSKIIDAIQQTAQRRSAEEELHYGDYCDWHDSCDCNE